MLTTLMRYNNARLNFVPRRFVRRYFCMIFIIKITERAAVGDDM